MKTNKLNAPHVTVTCLTLICRFTWVTGNCWNVLTWH